MDITGTYYLGRMHVRRRNNNNMDKINPNNSERYTIAADLNGFSKTILLC